MKLKARAKINLTLDVLHKRSDNYHEIEMIMQLVDLYDSLEIREGEGIEIVCSHPFVPTDEGNLVYKAAKSLQKYTGTKKGAKITIEKRIPVAAGLGGGSSDCATTLMGLNKFWKLNLSLEELAKLGKELGADVPFFIKGGTQLAKGIGEDLTLLPSLPPVWVVLAKPNLGVSTKEVYLGLEIDKITKRPNTQAMISAITEGNIKEVSNNLCNVLETVTLRRYSTVKILKDRITQLGACGTLMSGSGPTVFGLCSTYERALKIAKSLGTLAEEVFVTKTTDWSEINETN
ncbi:4-(cytidine 5'-diphospho)-2-C-methyl-D-erythritol kinase [Alkalicella caledoniensis]|uniref:4-diphosphocytidyl-2-C-methyl-D-erythritol kinase n=1 Tax=Alkalicella caledoniensis TaxID=2731377 RepID=A0A7G9W870_ALKCA|nr:4-(cytidine 5'-diphospho)-2-C-methyl-D-erythritol kinase [Alkalicella caledoniensis]QNO14882.1 4-(cytidine 5'-diphospho)-2-C-methyl-D-erythritol kinase [Alkalicella caledoniensis]